LAAVLRVNQDLLCRIEQFEGQPLLVKKRQRSVTPIRKLPDEEPLPTTPKTAKEGEVKSRKATKIMKAQMDKFKQ
jgi:hypothetical protein